MTGLHRIPFALLVALSLVSAGCDDDDDDDGKNGDGGGDGTDADAGRDAGGGGADGTACTGTFEGYTATDILMALGEDPEGACVTEAQVEEVCAVSPDRQAGIAGRACFLAGEEGDDLIACTIEGGAGTDGVRDVASNLSDDCLRCYAEAVRCSAESRCAAPCAVDVNSEACITCRAEEGCTGGFYDCSGLPTPDEL